MGGGLLRGCGTDVRTGHPNLVLLTLGEGGGASGLHHSSHSVHFKPLHVPCGFWKVFWGVFWGFLRVFGGFWGLFESFWGFLKVLEGFFVFLSNWVFGAWSWFGWVNRNHSEKPPSHHTTLHHTTPHHTTPHHTTPHHTTPHHTIPYHITPHHPPDSIEYLMTEPASASAHKS